MLWFCLPWGWLAYLLFELAFKQALAALLPESIFRRIKPTDLLPFAGASVVAVSASLMVGALTHVVLDAFTHTDGFAVRALPWLQWPLGEVMGKRVYVCQVLQHVSTVLGLALLGRYMWRWLQDEVPRPHRARSLSAHARCRIVFCLPVTWAVATIWQVAKALQQGSIGVADVPAAFAFTGVPIALVVTLVYCAIWHVWRLRWGRRCKRSVALR